MTIAFSDIIISKAESSRGILASILDGYTKVFPTFPTILKHELRGCGSVLDIGCGRGGRARILDSMHPIGADLYGPYLESCKYHGLYSGLLMSDASRIGIRNRAFDGAIALDVIEHLTKEQGLLLIAEMERIARKKLIVFTPNGFNPKRELEDECPLQAHRSGWTAEEFRTLGFRVIGMGGLRPLRGEHGRLRFSPSAAWRIVADFTEKFVKERPDDAFSLLSLKEL